MALPLIGNPITMGQINEELQHSTITQISLSNTNVRALAEKLTGQISLRDFYGKILNYTNDYGWFAGGGEPSKSIVERIHFATDTSTIIMGSLSLSRRWLTVVNNKTGAWFAGGSLTSTIDKLTFSMDSATAIVKSSLPFNVQALAGVNDSITNGWFAGGTTGNWAEAAGIISSITKLTFANDTAMAAYRSTLSATRASLAGTCNKIAGWFAGGYIEDITTVSRIDKLSFATDTINAIDKLCLTSPKCDIAVAGNLTDAWFVGGDISASLNNSSRIDRITFATDTNTTLFRGLLIFPTRRMTGCSNNFSSAWFGGGITTTTISNIYKLIFATDTVPVIATGSLIIARDSMTAV